MENKEAIKYLIPPVPTSTIPHNEYLKEKEAYELAIKALRNERPQGKWIMDKNGDYICDQCHNYPLRNDNEELTLSSYCPNCGADMRGNNKEYTFDDYLKEQLKDPEFRKEWEKLCDKDIQKGSKV